MTDTQPVPARDPRHDPSTEALTLELVRRAQAGDEAALEELFSLHRDRLQRFVRRRLGAQLRAQQEETEDVLHSAYRGALRSLPEFEPRGEDAWVRWLGTIIANTLAGKARRYRALKRAGQAGRIGGTEGLGLLNAESSSEPSPSDSAAAREAKNRLYDALERLPEERRWLLVQAHISKRPLPELAEELGCTTEAVRQRILRAEQALKVVLEHLRAEDV